MNVTLLGTGDATGTPKIGCGCPQCMHAKEAGVTRLRTSLLVEHGGKNILVDSSPDLLGLLMRSMGPAETAVFLEFQLLRRSALVFVGRIEMAGTGRRD